MSEARRLHLIRHGRADRSVAEFLDTELGRQHDPPLDEVGREQARLLARRLRMMPRPHALYCSALRRARETVTPYADATKADVTHLDRLAEWYGGAWEMKGFEEIFRDHPEVLGLIRTQDPIWHLAPESEPGPSFRRRVVDTVERILADHPEGDVWIVCHAGVINAYIGHVIALGDREMFLLPENTSLNTVVIRGAERHLWFLNDTAHLSDPHFFDDP